MDVASELRKIATSDPDPARRQSAVERLHRRGEAVEGGSHADALRRRVSESAARTERLRGEESPFGDGIEGVGRRVANEVGTGLSDALDVATGGNYRRGRDAAMGAAGLDVEGMRADEARAFPETRTVGRALPAFAAGAALAPAMAGSSFPALMGKTALADAPLALGRRLADGEDAGDAAAGAAGDAALAGATAGLLRAPGAIRDRLRAPGTKLGDALSARDAARAAPVGPGSREVADAESLRISPLRAASAYTPEKLHAMATARTGSPAMDAAALQGSPRDAVDRIAEAARNESARAAGPRAQEIIKQNWKKNILQQLLSPSPPPELASMAAMMNVPPPMPPESPAQMIDAAKNKLRADAESAKTEADAHPVAKAARKRRARRQDPADRIREYDPITGDEIR